MTVAVPAPHVTPAAWYTRPTVILSTLATAVLITALFARSPLTGRDGDPRATSYSTEPLGARMFYELSARLGWKVRRETTASMPDDARSIVVMLDPTTSLTPSETHQLLQHVRSGGALLTALGKGTSELSDSLDVHVDERGSYLDVTTGVTVGPASDPSTCAKSSVRGSITQQGLWVGLPTLFALKNDDLTKYAPRVFISSQTITIGTAKVVPRPSVVGFPYGAGRVVVAADVDVFRNDAIRVCSYGFDVGAVRMLEYLRSGFIAPRNQVVFDEYHLARVARTGTIGAAENYLLETPSGHALLQLSIAGLVLLLAAATRVLPPRADIRVDRRSPLEHVDALGRAYLEVDATQTATLRLVSGLRRRVDRSSSRAATSDGDDLFLSRIAEIHPEQSKDVLAVRNALAGIVTRDGFKEVGAAIRRIEIATTNATASHRAGEGKSRPPQSTRT